jgi:hypothetical protein
VRVCAGDCVRSSLIRASLVGRALQLSASAGCCSLTGQVLMIRPRRCKYCETINSATLASRFTACPDATGLPTQRHGCPLCRRQELSGAWTSSKFVQPYLGGLSADAIDLLNKVPHVLVCVRMNTLGGQYSRDATAWVTANTCLLLQDLLRPSVHPLPMYPLPSPPPP